MFAAGTHLFQYELTTSMAQVYPSTAAPRLEVPAEIVLLFIANTTNASRTFNFCYDNDGTTFTQATALYW